MMKLVVTLLNFYILLSTSLLAQNRPPAEVDKAIRATVDVLINPGAVDYSAFIKSYYSQNQISNVGLDSLVSHVKEIKKSTAGAGGVDVANDNGVIQIRLSEGVHAIVELVWVKDNPGKIHSLSLARTKSPSAMTADENYDNALQGRVRKMESLPNYTSDAEFEDFITENFSTSYISQNPIGEIVLLLRKLSLSVASASMLGAKRAADGKGAILELRGGKSADVLITIEENAPYRINQISDRV